MKWSFCDWHYYVRDFYIKAKKIYVNFQIIDFFFFHRKYSHFNQSKTFIWEILNYSLILWDSPLMRKVSQVWLFLVCIPPLHAHFIIHFFLWHNGCLKMNTCNIKMMYSPFHDLLLINFNEKYCIKLFKWSGMSSII